MSENEPNNGGISGQVVGAVITVAVAVLTAGTAPWWWPKTDISQSPPQSPSQSPPQSPPQSPSQRTPINLAYAGDFHACNLPISISIGDQQFYPQGSFYQANEVQVGQQRYQINGQITCPALGNCQVYGEGYINVIPSNTYHVGWQQTDWGRCSATLQ